VLRVDNNGWLATDEAGDPEIELVPSKSHYALQVAAPLGVIWHTSDTPATRTAEAMVHNIADNTALKKSWHIMIGSDGKLWQSVAFNQGSWHVGNGGTVGGHHFDNVNRGTIGVEFQNAGGLRSLGGAFYMYPYWKRGEDGKTDRSLGVDPKLKIDPATVGRDSDGGYWQRFTDQQVNSAEALIRALAAWQPAELGNAAAFRYGHVNFPGKTGKEDPGKLWPPIREAILSRVFGGGGGLVAAGFLGLVLWGMFA
jgi:N-acetyl-anhydromuramyl-L-alanine amidase AmpD